MGWFWSNSTESATVLHPPEAQLPSRRPPVPENASEAECPVDHQTRQAWLDAAKSQRQPSESQRLIRTPSRPQDDSCDSRTIDQSNGSPLSPSISAPPSLSHHREVSSIPRAVQPEDKTGPLANNETNAHTSRSGRWIYPSESMFFEAMRRKNHDPQAADMKTIVPIHNAVNERAWQEILQWEKQYDSAGCGGPKLVSFRGDASKLTPRARWNIMLGYQKPFDRHDWTVDRCGVQVEYVIDFYSGKPGTNEGLSFYLDVRPKFNTLEGAKMRARKIIGL